MLQLFAIIDILIISLIIVFILHIKRYNFVLS
jgi:hypothetical protein